MRSGSKATSSIQTFMGVLPPVIIKAQVELVGFGHCLGQTGVKTQLPCQRSSGPAKVTASGHTLAMCYRLVLLTALVCEGLACGQSNSTAQPADARPRDPAPPPADASSGGPMDVSVAPPSSAPDGPVVAAQPGVCVKGTIVSNMIWSSKNAPLSICGNVTVASGVTVTIEPGTKVEIDPGTNIAVANGGRLLAEGTAANKILFTRTAGAAGAWGNITITGGAGSPETRISHAHFEFNVPSPVIPCLRVTGGTVWFDHLSFGTTASPYIHVDGASFVISSSVFPTPTAKFEPVHGTLGIKAGGHGVINHCFFGAPNGYNDTVDFTGGNRPGGAIIHFINNVFMGSDDDLLDLDGTDAWVEGNIFMHAHKNRGTPDSATAISGGADSGQTSEITAIGNIIYDCDGAMNAKEGNFYTLVNNTIVHQNHAAGDDTDAAVITVADNNATEGAGVFFESNIIFDAEKLTRELKNAVLTFTNNLMPFPWTGPGGGNATSDPRFKRVPQVSETNFTTWAQAQVMRDWLSLSMDSPGRITGPLGLDKGGVVPIGVAVSVEPIGKITQPNAVVRVGINRAGSGIPTAGWPLGAGYTHYKWRLDTGAWSAETPIASPLMLTDLSAGPHYVEVVGKRDSGLYQNDPVFGVDAVITRSQSWMVAR